MRARHVKRRLIVVGIILVVGLVTAATFIARVRLDHLEGFYAPIL